MLNAEVRLATCRVKCGEDIGTGWLVSPDKVITARHCVLDALDENESQKITLAFERQEISEELTANIIDHDASLDICLLSIETISHVNPITLGDSIPIEGCQFYSYGYPVNKLNIGHRLEGTISQVLDIPKLVMDIDLHIDSSATLTNYQGFSGAALICDGVCSGVIRLAVDNTVGAISTACMGEFLRRHGIFPSKNSDEDSVVQNLASREEFTQEFDSLVSTQSGGYIFIEGAHGIGKSTFCETYTPTNSFLEHFDTYSFTAQGNTVNTIQLSQPQEFFNWLSMQVSIFLTNNPARIAKKDYLDLIKDVERLLVELGRKYSAQGKIGVLFIDGLDEVEKLGREVFNKFIGLLPLQVPAGLAIVFSAPSYSRLAAQLGKRLRNDTCLSIPSLTNSAIQDFCRRELVKDRSTPITIKLICDRAQGHPLYLRYLIDLVNSGLENDELATLPLIDGSIRNYYEALWNQFQGDADAINLLAIAVRLRWGIPIQQFTEILNQAEQAALVSTIARIQHLLLAPNETTIYHSSFSDFLIEKTQLREPDIQLRLAEYCESHKSNSYGLMNIIYHGLKSENTEQSHVISLCNQGWADDCVIEGIKPDILLRDVNEALSAAIEIGSLTETVRILLLSQRLQFRYDTLFAQSADLTANALIALGKAEEVLQHIIRYGHLIIPVREALKVALKLIEAKNQQDALKLLNIIETSIETQITSENGVSFREFLALYDLQLQQFFIKERAGDKRAGLELQNFSFFWMKYIDTSSKDELSSKLIRTEMMTYLRAAMMCLSGRYLSIAQIRQFYSGATSELVEPFIYAASYYRELCDYFNVPPEQKLLEEVFTDLQTLISEDWDGSKKIHPSTIDSLISLGVPNSVIRIISGELAKALSPIKFIAKDNVSIDESLLYEGMIHWRHASLLDTELPCPISITVSPSGWKDGIDSIYRTVAWCDGSARRLKESADASGLEIVWSILEQTVFAQLRFSLADRVTWDDAYALPEAVFPEIYHYLTVLVADLYPCHLGYLVSFIEEQFDSQYGIYSEGFRQILSKFLNYMIKIPLNEEIEDQLFSLTERWRDFVLNNLKNRHELVPELLTLVPLFAHLNAAEEALRTYQYVLAFSMGPSWYKEDQFGLMITALESSDLSVSVESGVLPRIASLLDTASGEMTFQRFIRYAKRDLIRALCKRGGFINATNYFIRQTYGTNEQLYQEATQGNIDRVSELRGTRFPGGSLDEQDAILYIVKPAISITHWALCWAILEIFQFGDSRHLDNYAEAYALLMQKTQEDRDITTSMMKRLELICESEVESEQRSKFLLSVHRHLPTELQDQFESLFGVSSNTFEAEFTKNSSHISDNDKESLTEKQPSRDDFLMPGTFGTQASIHVATAALEKAERALKRRNSSEAQREIISGLESIQRGGWPIWGGQIEEVSKGQQLLLQTNKSSSPSDVIKLCPSLILGERYAERWRIADSLIEWLAKNDSHDKQVALLKLAIEHIEIMVGSADNYIQNYDFLEESRDSDTSYSLTKLIIHAIDHPTWLRSEKASDMLLWLLRSHSKYIQIFGSKAFSMEDHIHPDVICGVLDQLSRSDSKQLWDQLAPILNFEGIRQDCKHIGRLSVLMRIASRAAQRGSDSASRALALLKENIPDIAKASDTSQQIKVDLPSWAKVIWLQWSRLKVIGLVKPELVDQATVVMREQCSPLSIETNLEIEQLLAEGMGGNTRRLGRWEAKVRFAFQVALLPITTTNMLAQVEEIFRPYNPSRLDNLRSVGFSSPTIDWLAQLESSSGAIKPIKGRHIYLDFFERVWFEGNWKYLRLTAYFYESGKKPQPTLPSGRFFSTEEPTSKNISYWDTCNNVKELPAYFGSFIPAVPSSTLMQITRATNSDFIRSYWRSGRVEESMGGGPEHEGCYLAINAQALRCYQNLKLAWVYEIDGKFAGLFNPN